VYSADVAAVSNIALPPNRALLLPGVGVAAASGGRMLKAEPPSAAALVEVRRQQNAIR
jgi:hypothetical protein